MCHFLAPAGQPEMMRENFMHWHLCMFVVHCSCMKFYAPETSCHCEAGLFPGVVTEGGQPARRFAFDALIRHSEAVTDVTAVGIFSLQLLPRLTEGRLPHQCCGTGSQ